MVITMMHQTRLQKKPNLNPTTNLGDYPNQQIMHLEVPIHAHFNLCSVHHIIKHSQTSINV